MDKYFKTNPSWIRLGSHVLPGDVRYSLNNVTVVQLLIWNISHRHTALRKLRYYLMIIKVALQLWQQTQLNTNTVNDLMHWTGSLRSSRVAHRFLISGTSSRHLLLRLARPDQVSVIFEAQQAVCMRYCVYHFALTMNRVSPSFN